MYFPLYPLTCFHSRSCCRGKGGATEERESRKGTWRTLTLQGMLGEEGQGRGERADGVRGEQSEEEDEDDDEEEEVETVLSCRRCPHRLFLQERREGLSL